MPLRDITDTMHIRLFMADSLVLPLGLWQAQNVQSTFWRFYQNTNEGAYLRLAPNNALYRLQAGRVYFVPPGVGFSCGSDAVFHHFYFHFDLIGLPSLTLRALFGGPVVLAPDLDFESRVEQFAGSMEATKALTIEQQCRAKSLIYDGLGRYLSELTPAQRERGLQQAQAMEPVAPAIRFIEENLAQPLPNAMLAQVCCLSPDHFAHRFKACLGQAPGNYIRERRVERAAQKLLFSGDTLDNIAESCGFGSRFYLTRVFTRAMGIPPAAYRKAIRLV